MLSGNSVFMPKQYRFVILHLFILLLPASNFILILAYGVLGLPASLIKLSLYWEEILAVLAFGGTLLANFHQRKWRLSYRLHLAFVDLLIACQIIVVIIEAFVSWYSYPNLKPVDLIRGLRDQLIYILVYLVGRMTIPDERQTWLILRSLIIITVATSVFGFVERFLIPIDFFLWIKTPQFFTDIVGYKFPDASLGLPENFWTSVGGHTVRRATSVYTSSQPFSISFMLLLPPCIWLITQNRIARRLSSLLSIRSMFFLFFVAFVALVATITRANIILGLLQVALSVLILRTNVWKVNRQLMKIAGIIVLASLIVLLAAYRPIVNFVHSTLTFTESSSSFHLDSLVADYEYLQSHPFGLGIATSGVTGGRIAERFQDIPSGEGQYSKMIREMGIPGFVFYLGILLGVTRYSYVVFSRNKNERLSIAGLGFTVLLAGIAFLLNSITTEWHGALSTSLPFWWLAGTITTLSFYKKNYASSRT
jgi:hypothetical protein